ncbi:hypothetical protein SERLADRAFT_404682 [Serpula lacrymans var. lacrymans S7.9]|uniref:Uncharacterized protein n=1 Tax=Serpula lacrymans var. lacrymans (strain S7.9) TaxID=578457 RepID=F8NED6_SERL9|nr:uncharacterized protein SERLADRAFT_404682 [Serpula lacrymans var. lacrymans S7.9]EGO30570.1 hypothetical protein SERLADRAFT_404682 [Serpula lacrymans var. lacrymans S7.9]
MPTRWGSSSQYLFTFWVGHTLDHVTPGKQPQRSLRMSKSQSQKSNNQEVKDEGESVSQSSSGNAIGPRSKLQPLSATSRNIAHKEAMASTLGGHFGQGWQLALHLFLQKDQQNVRLAVVQNGAGFLRTKYNEISAIANLSGVPWDNKLGLNILDKCEAVWAEIAEVSSLPVSATTSSTMSIARTLAVPTVSHAVPAVVAATPAIPCAAVSDIAAKGPPGCINNWLGGLPSPTSAAVLPLMSLTTSASSKRSARDAEIDIDEGATVISHSKSAGGSN